MTSAYFLAETVQEISKKNCMTTSESKGRFFLQNESIRIVNWNALACTADMYGTLYFTFL